MKLTSLLLFAAFVPAGCGTPRLMETRDYQERPKLDASLFRGEQDFTSEDAVQRILSSKIAFPQQMKIAIFKYASEEEDNLATRYYGYYYWRSENYIKLQQRLIDTLQSMLLSTGRVSEATIMPTMIVSKQPTVAMLRQAAVRLQAHALLVFRNTNDVYYDYQVFSKDKIKAYSTCEVILFDTKTGIIPFTTIVSRDLLTERLPAEVDREEAMRRAQHQVSLEAMASIGDELARFLSRVQ